MANRLTVARESGVARQVVGNIEPGDAFRVEAMRRRHEGVGRIERRNMDLDQRPELAVVAFPGQRRAAFATERPPDPGRGLINPPLVPGKSQLIRQGVV